MRNRKILILWFVILLSSWMVSCYTVPVQPEQTDNSTVTISRKTLSDLMESCARCKSELNECLERESVKK